MKLQLAAGITAVALLGAACSAQHEPPAPSPSSHSASPGLAPEHVRSVPDDCSTEAAKAPGKYEKYREEVLSAIRAGTPAVDGLSKAWGVDVRGWLYPKGKK